MKVICYNDVDAFSKDTRAFLAGSYELEMYNNLLLGVIGRFRNKEYERAYMFTVQDGAGRIVLAAIQTPPHNMVISHGDRNAIPCLVKYSKERNFIIPGVIGPEDIAREFTRLWKNSSTDEIAPRMNLIFYALTSVTPPKVQAKGRFRQSTPGDHAILTQWFVNFAIDANLGGAEQKTDPQNVLNKITAGTVYLWENEGKPVSMVEYTPLTGNGVRIGSVYTPLERRGHGYGSSVVASLSQFMLKNGKKWCSLFADKTNSSTNRIYQKIGYQERLTYHEYGFGIK